jgi:hypothetical protein
MAIRRAGAISRRCLLSTMAGVTGATAMLGTTMTANAAKLSQRAAQYRNSPKDNQRCDNCALWQPPASCKSVEGPIAAQGWCNLWVAKRRQSPRG